MPSRLTGVGFWPDRCLRCPIRDEEEVDISTHFEAAERFIEAAERDGEIVLVHCHEGKSRSVSLILAYLMQSQVNHQAFVATRSIPFAALGPYPQGFYKSVRAAMHTNDASKNQFLSDKQHDVFYNDGWGKLFSDPEKNVLTANNEGANFILKFRPFAAIAQITCAFYGRAGEVNVRVRVATSHDLHHVCMVQKGIGF